MDGDVEGTGDAAGGVEFGGFAYVWGMLLIWYLEEGDLGFEGCGGFYGPIRIRFGSGDLVMVAISS